MSLFPPAPEADQRPTIPCSIAFRTLDGSIVWDMASLYHDVIHGDRAIEALEQFAEGFGPGTQIVHIMKQPSWKDPAHGDTGSPAN